MIGDLGAAHARRYELPMLTAPVSFPEREVPMDPYALGLLLVDGCLTGTGSTAPSFSPEDQELAEALEEALTGVTLRHRGGPEGVLNRTRAPGDVVTLENPVTAILRQLDLRVPVPLDVRSGRLPAQLRGDPPRSPPGPPGCRWRSCPAVGPYVPCPVHDLFDRPARRRDRTGAVARRSCLHPPSADGGSSTRPCQGPKGPRPLRRPHRRHPPPRRHRALPPQPQGREVRRGRRRRASDAVHRQHRARRS